MLLLCGGPGLLCRYPYLTCRTYRGVSVTTSSSLTDLDLSAASSRNLSNFSLVSISYKPLAGFPMTAFSLRMPGASWHDLKMAASTTRWISVEKFDVNAVTESYSLKGGCMPQD